MMGVAGAPGTNGRDSQHDGSPEAITDCAAMQLELRTINHSWRVALGRAAAVLVAWAPAICAGLLLPGRAVAEASLWLTVPLPAVWALMMLASGGRNLHRRAQLARALGSANFTPAIGDLLDCLRDGPPEVVEALGRLLAAVQASDGVTLSPRQQRILDDLVWMSPVANAVRGDDPEHPALALARRSICPDLLHGVSVLGDDRTLAALRGLRRKARSRQVDELATSAMRAIEARMAEDGRYLVRPRTGALPEELLRSPSRDAARHQAGSPATSSPRASGHDGGEADGGLKGASGP